MAVGIQKDSANILLRSLLPPDYVSLARHCTRLRIAPRAVLVRAGQAIEHLDFLEDGIMSLSADAAGHGACLIALVGREGCVGWSAAMDVGQSPFHIRAGGEGARLLRIDMVSMLRLLHDRPSLRASLMRYIHVVMVQMQSTIVSSKIYPVERRLARLILMHHDRASGDDICATHQDMADMLIVRRASITDALHVMEGNRLIASIRNHIVMRDRTGMRLVAGGAYGAAEEHYGQCITPPPEAR